MDWLFAFVMGAMLGTGLLAIYLGERLDAEYADMCNVLSGQYSEEDNRCYATIDEKTKGLDHKGMLKQMESKND